MEAAKYGPPGQEQVSHKACFTCQNEGCTWKLDMRSYHFFEGKVYCKVSKKTGATIGIVTLVC